MTDFENELFRVDSLDEITREHFGMTCVAAMRAQPEIRGLLGSLAWRRFFVGTSS